MLDSEASRLNRFDWPRVGLSYIQGDPETWTPETIGRAFNGMVQAFRMYMQEVQELLENQNHSIINVAPIISAGSTPTSPGVSPEDPEAFLYAQLKGCAQSGYWDPTARTIGEAKGGLGGNFCGPVFFRPNVENVAGVDGDGGIADNNDLRRQIVAVGGFEAGIAFPNFFGVHRWAKATSDWSNQNANYVSYVDCNLVTDYTGTNTVKDQYGTTRTVRVYLPQNSVMDPNVRTGDVIRFTWDRLANRAVADDPGVLDDKIGTVRTFYTADTTIRDSYGSGVRGWFTMNSSNSTQDMRGRTVYGYNPADATYDQIGETVAAAGGGGTISGSGTVSISAHAAAGADGNTITTSGPSTTGVTISATGGGGATITSDGTTITLNQQFPASGSDTATAYAGTFSTGGFSQSHTHTILRTSIKDAISATADSHTHTFTQGDVRTALANHTALNISDIAAGLSISGGAAAVTAGRVFLMIQRMS